MDARLVITVIVVAILWAFHIMVPPEPPNVVNRKIINAVILLLLVIVIAFMTWGFPTRG